ncbi:hypothetical protein BTRA_1165 [Burkholderia thailandensis USAMRU Malaysia |nr:hypothetical protein BTRA_1165 [Burkholderia thailandensis USAMRU Malaysia \
MRAPGRTTRRCRPTAGGPGTRRARGGAPLPVRSSLVPDSVVPDSGMDRLGIGMGRAVVSSSLKALLEMGRPHAPAAWRERARGGEGGAPRRRVRPPVRGHGTARAPRLERDLPRHAATCRRMRRADRQPRAHRCTRHVGARARSSMRAAAPRARPRRADPAVTRRVRQMQTFAPPSRGPRERGATDARQTRRKRAANARRATRRRPSPGAAGRCPRSGRSETAGTRARR